MRNIEGLDKELREKTVGTCGVEEVSERAREIKKPLYPREKRKIKTWLFFNLSSHNHCRKNLCLEALLLSSATRAPSTHFNPELRSTTATFPVSPSVKPEDGGVS